MKHLRNLAFAGLALPLVVAAAAFAQTTNLDKDVLSGLRLRNIGPANMSGRIVDVAVVESDPYTIYAASATGGIFKTTNNGVTFKPVFEREATHSIGAIAVHQRNPQIVWVGTGERANRQSNSWGDGVYKSTDGGGTWVNMGLRDTHHIGRIALHPTNPDVLFVAAMGHLWGPNPERGLYKSEDGGKTWNRVLAVDDNTGVVDVAMDPSDPSLLYAAAYQRQRKAFGFHGGGPGSALYKSTDAGRTWKKLTKGLPEGDKGRIGISIYRKDPRTVYVSVEQGARYTASTTYEERKAGIYRSEDKGETWTFMSDWNPRPMYASQILVDPSDDKRIYMENAFSYSDDGGKKFTVPRQSVHSDDRVLWVDPKDSRHLVKGSDGALALSYDRGITWLFVAHLPVSQYYRVAVDMRKPFWIYGGLQDNGSWAGPSATYRSEGILNEDWLPTGGGDGFLSLTDPADDNIIYSESQYLGLSQVNLATLESRTIRPDNKRGYIESRRNWKVWGTDKPYPLLGEQMAPANWDGPFAISPHDRNTIYSGTNHLWKTSDQGHSWTSLGVLTTDVDRSKLKVMGQTSTSDTPSLDDGVPYYPALTQIAESPLRQGLLYVGADDGSLSVSRDGGKTWTRVSDRFPGLPPSTFVSGIEPSRHQEAVVYAVFDGHRSDDYNNYAYRSTDYGQSWTSIAGDLPRERVLRTLREDRKNPNLLFLGAELGFFISIDAGRHWTELKNNLPTLPVYDMVVHPRDNDLVLGTHGRGIWILDNIASLQELTPEVLGSPARLFTIEPAEMIRYARQKAQSGDLTFRGENPPGGAIVDYYLGAAREDVSLAVIDEAGREVQKLEPGKKRGINRVLWNLRHASLPKPAGPQAASDEGPERPPEGPRGPWVVPGRYVVRLSVGDKTYEQPVEAREDPRVQVGVAERRSWTQTLLEIGQTYTAANTMVETVLGAEKRAGASAATEVKELKDLVIELRRRTRLLYDEVSAWTGAPTEDQLAQKKHYSDVVEELRRRVSTVTSN